LKSNPYNIPPLVPPKVRLCIYVPVLPNVAVVAIVVGFKVH